MKLYYWSGRPNVRDYYTAWLFDKMGVPYNRVSKNADLIATGSILSHDWSINKNTKIWGSRFIRCECFVSNKINLDNIIAIRGKLTKEKLKLTRDVVLGDPGLLVSRYYTCDHKHKYKYGIVSHFNDEEFLVDKFKNTNVPIISVNTNDVEGVINKICECDFIFSTSLHGIIFSHSVGIPTIHLENTVLQDDEENFKFKDYYSTLNVPYTKEIIVDFGPELVDKYLEHPLRYKPTSKRVEEIQESLLRCFPYPINNKTANKLKYIKFK